MEGKMEDAVKTLLFYSNFQEAASYLAWPWNEQHANEPTSRFLTTTTTARTTICSTQLIWIVTTICWTTPITSRNHYLEPKLKLWRLLTSFRLACLCWGWYWFILPMQVLLSLVRCMHTWGLYRKLPFGMVIWMLFHHDLLES